MIRNINPIFQIFGILSVSDPGTGGGAAGGKTHLDDVLHLQQKCADSVQETAPGS
jgi:hypothetical protein